MVVIRETGGPVYQVTTAPGRSIGHYGFGLLKQVDLVATTFEWSCKSKFDTCDQCYLNCVHNLQTTLVNTILVLWNFPFPKEN